MTKSTKTNHQNTRLLTRQMGSPTEPHAFENNHSKRLNFFPKGFVDCRNQMKKARGCFGKSLNGTGAQEDTPEAEVLTKEATEISESSGESDELA